MIGITILGSFKLPTNYRQGQIKITDQHYHF
jgi:hypothetical protein